MIICLPLTFAGASTMPTPESTRFACGRAAGLLSHLHLLHHYGKLSSWLVLTAYLLTHYSLTAYLHLLHDREAWVVKGSRRSDVRHDVRQAPERRSGLASAAPQQGSLSGPRGQP